jgi:lariat debranching enzyme
LVSSPEAMKGAVDIFLSHDWPSGIWDYGDVSQLLRLKPYFQEDIQTGKLGSQPLRYLLEQIQPDFWFAAHLHVKFPAIYPHYLMLPASSFPDPPSELAEEVDSSSAEVVTAESTEKNDPLIPVVKKLTRFLALDKIIPNR